MYVFRYDREQGRNIETYGSRFTMSRLVHTDALHVGCMYIPKGGGVGRHAAVTAQLFVVVEGRGWVTGQDGERIYLQRGEAAYWQAGEEHEAGTEVGMTALVIESDALAGSADHLGPVSGARRRE